MGNFFNSSIGRKVSMALSAIFLMIFLLQHFAINFTSVVSPDLFNELSHFMGTNPLVQFVLQPVLIFGVVFHFVMGFILELKNRKANSLKYAKNNGAANSSWMSRNMIWSGLAILSFMLLHFVDFWFPELNYKYFAANPEDPTRYFHELQDKFTYAPRVIAYVIAFVFLSLHLLHGFTSALQSLGSTLGRKKILIKISYIYSLALPLGFIYIALFHYFTQH
jgi:succinate dehydrogenase / fumarate reductase cytochrome b subunit|tara:strand:- start:914 stop:1576 length:663 start_codon:yes stop_codon:yes gene_type:complete